MKEVERNITFTITSRAMRSFSPTKHSENERKGMRRAIICGGEIITPIIRNLCGKLNREYHNFSHNSHGVPNKRHVWFKFMRFENKNKDKIRFSSAPLNFPKSVDSGNSKNKQVALTRNNNF